MTGIDRKFAPNLAGPGQFLMIRVLFMRMTTKDFYRSRVKPALNPVARSIVLLALCAGTSGCTSVPDVNGIVDQSFSDDLRGQGRKRVGFTAAGHSRYAHLPTAVAQNLLLFCTRRKHH